MKLEEKKVEKALGLRQGLLSLHAGSMASARALMPAVSFLNFPQRAAPGGFRHLRPGRDGVNETGVMESRRSGEGRAGAEATASGGLRNDMPWRRKMVSARPTKKLLHGVNRHGLLYGVKLLICMVPPTAPIAGKGPDMGQDAV